MSNFHRDSGILLHVSSLPSPGGIGEFGPACIEWLEKLAGAGQTLWQILPLCPTGYGDSPYQGVSAFAANPLFLSAEWIAEDGIALRGGAHGYALPLRRRVDFRSVSANKARLARDAHEGFRDLAPNHPLRAAFSDFVGRNAYWLENAAAYDVLKNRFDLRAWTEWPDAFRDRDPGALSGLVEGAVDELERFRLVQFFLRRHWDRIRDAASRAGIRIIGDLPIFVAHDSADVWANRRLFKLDASGDPTVVAGVPPDYFSSTGQRWGNPLYDWEEHRRENFAWWISRLGALLEWVDLARIDHFRGFAAAWEIPATAETALEGEWMPSPGREFFELLRSRFEPDPLPIIAEDLGVITPDVVSLRDDFGLPGIRVLQFAFGDDPMRDTFLPEACGPDCVAYSGTHDNDTVRGWFDSEAGVGSTRSEEQILAERAAARGYFGTDGSEIHWDFIEALFRSNAGAVLVPFQDVLGLGSDARMNAPGTASGNWTWRFESMSTGESAFRRLSALSRDSRRGAFAGRAASPVAAPT